MTIHPDDPDRSEAGRPVPAAREPYELRATETAVAAHRLGETGADEPDLDRWSLDLALGD